MAYVRKTEDEWQIQFKYFEQPWEEVCAYDNRRDPRKDIKEYRLGCPAGCFYRIVKKRVKKEVTIQ